LSPHFRVIAPDLPGHGASDDTPREYEVEDFTQSLLEFMDALGIERAGLAGHHTGAVLALSIAVNHSERVTRIVMSGAGYEPKEAIEAFLERLKTQPMSRDLPMTEDGSFLVDAWQRYRALSPLSDLAVRFRPFVIGLAARQRPSDAHLAVFRWELQEDRLPRLRCPTLLLTGDADIFYREDWLQAAGTRIPDGQTRIIPGGAGMICFEKPQEWALAVLEFMRG